MKVVLAKPQTYMNLSGESVAELVNYYKMDPEEEMIVIYDDISLAPGNLRIRKKEVRVGTMESKYHCDDRDAEFLRIKVGVGENRRDGILQIMCWDILIQQTARK